MQPNSPPIAAYLPEIPSDIPGDIPNSFDWSDLLDFNLDEEALNTSILHSEPQITEQTTTVDQSQTGRVRKRDPMLVCPNFLAGRVPCACPELDAMLAEEEEEGVFPGKKRAKAAGRGGGSVRCQVAGCEADISELKGYHKRHRVCLRCANATAVVVDGENRRYCQQCGKFHILSDFDEGKRSCRRKLERHNTRRRRKANDSGGSMEKEPEQIVLVDDASGDDDTGKGQIEEKETLGESDAHVSTPGSTIGLQNLQSDNALSFGASGEIHIDVEKQNRQFKRSQSDCDNRSAFSSVCPAGRISFKLYDWNPAEFPRRLRHQVL